VGAYPATPDDPERPSWEPPDALSAEAEFEMYETVLARLREQQEAILQLHALWREAKLSTQRFAIMEYSRQGLKPRAIAKHLQTTSNNVRVQKHDAIAQIERHRRQASAGR